MIHTVEQPSLGDVRKRCPECKATRFVREALVELDSEGNYQEVGAELRCVGCRTLWVGWEQLEDYRPLAGSDFSAAAAYDAVLAEQARTARVLDRPVVVES